jgi:hypothetical protein
MERAPGYEPGGSRFDSWRRYHAVQAKVVEAPVSGPGRPRVRPDHLIADKTSHAVSLSSCCQGLGREPRGFLVGLSGLQPGRQSAALASATSFAATCRSLCRE